MIRLLPDSVKEKLRVRAGVATPLSRLSNLRACGFRPAAVIDCGAYHGAWSLMVRKLFPDAHLLLIEAQPGQQDRLQNVCRRLGRAEAVQALLGRSPGLLPFILSETNSRIAPPGYTPGAGESLIHLPVCTLDSLAEQYGFRDASFLKLDLQGHELDALAAAGPLLGTAEVIQIETSLIPIGNPPLFAEVAAFFGAHGYRLYDIWGANYRPLDRALWQVDLVFVRQDSPLISSSRWM